MNDKELKRLKLTQPSIEQLGYRKRILSDPDTMDYNKGLDLRFDGYNNETGCILFDESKWENWYNHWFNNEKFRYYAYMVEVASNRPIGEVVIGFDESSRQNIISIIVECIHRRKGYGKEGLILLIEKAFNDFGLEVLSDEFPENRHVSFRLFSEIGFKQVQKNNGNVLMQIKKSENQTR